MEKNSFKYVTFWLGLCPEVAARGEYRGREETGLPVPLRKDFRSSNSSILSKTLTVTLYGLEVIYN